MNSQFSDLHDESFAMPVSGLFADLETGQGTVHLPDEFRATPARVQLELIAEWQRGLAQARQQAFEQLYAEVQARHCFATAEELAGHFAAACRELGEAWPPEFAARLRPRRGRAADNDGSC
jgi:hypothetical protein